MCICAFLFDFVTITCLVRSDLRIPAIHRTSVPSAILVERFTLQIQNFSILFAVPLSFVSRCHNSHSQEKRYQSNQNLPQRDQQTQTNEYS